DDNPHHVGAPMPGMVGSVAVQAGQAVTAGDTLLTIEAMKMEVAIKAERDGTIKQVLVASGTRIDNKDLLVMFA
ncbi:MAG: biotin/lipoyl-binding protein, partial [Pseudogulbenkiania sp.]|nr:biotin/lipoyl-binding protein [Pseudogulbenkiania sp.]